MYINCICIKRYIYRYMLIYLHIPQEFISLHISLKFTNVLLVLSVNEQGGEDDTLDRDLCEYGGRGGGRGWARRACRGYPLVHYSNSLLYTQSI